MLSQFFRSLRILTIATTVLIDYLWLDFLRRFRSADANRAAEARAYRRWGALLRRAALDLHGLIIKVGQFLSTRVDMLPDSFTKELSQLQDAVPGAPFPPVRRSVEASLGAPLSAVFADFEPEPVAAASLGQVHRASLKDGSTVAVKVLRPGIERLVETDLAALRKILWFLGRFTRVGRRFDLPAIMAEFKSGVMREIDYRQEADHMREFRRNFQGFPGVDVPVPVDHLVTQSVLVMEFIEGLRPTDRAGLVAAGIAPEPLAERLVDAYLKQTLVDGFVHVDPHPGNFIIRPDGTLVFVDFGMMDHVTPEDRANFARLTRAALTRDLGGAVEAVVALGFVRPGADLEILRDALGFLLDRVTGVPLAEGPELDSFLEDLRQWLYEEPLQFPAKYLFLGRAVGLLAGLATSLNPGINWKDVLMRKALPLLSGGTGTGGAAGGTTDEGGGESGAAGGFAELRDTLGELLQKLLGPQGSATLKVVWDEVKTQGLALVRLPALLDRVLAVAESGRLRVTPDFSPVTARLERQERALSRLVWAVVAVGGGVSGAILRVGGALFEARVAWSVAGFALLLVLWGGIGRRSGGSGSDEPRRHRHFHVPHRR
ncbi:MAG: ABC1 kinase family protein [Symbiobacteriia bacterium]